MKTHQIPEKYLPFLWKTLIVCLNENSAKPYEGHKRNITELEVLETKATQYHYSDKEGFEFTPTGAGTSSGNEPHNKEHYAKVFLNFFMKELHKLDQQGQYEKIILISPHTMKNEVKEKLPTELAKKAEIIPGNFYKSHPFDIVEKIEKTEFENGKKSENQ